PRPAEFTQALTEILHGLLVSFETEFAKGHFLEAAGFGIDHAQVTVGRGVQFFRCEYLHSADLEAAPDQRGEAGFVAGGIEEVAEHHGHAGLAGFQGTATQSLVEVSGARGRQGGEVLEELHGRLLAAHCAESAPDGPLEMTCGPVWRRTGG